MTRKEAREFAVKAVFQMEVHKDWDIQNVDKYIKNSCMDIQGFDGQDFYIKQIIKNLCNNLALIDSKIDMTSEWGIKRIAKTDLAITRVAITEILYLDDIPKSVAINEAVELSKKYSDDNSSKFVNAILGKIDK